MCIETDLNKSLNMLPLNNLHALLLWGNPSSHWLIEGSDLAL